jgi:hypothetical protein
MGDRWVPIPTIFKIQSPPKELSSSSKVHDLFDEEKTGWNQDMLARIFTDEERATINTIPISQTNQPDLQVWRCTNLGTFSVSSAYHLAKEVERRRSPEGSSNREESTMWRII